MKGKKERKKEGFEQAAQIMAVAVYHIISFLNLDCNLFSGSEAPQKQG